MQHNKLKYILCGILCFVAFINIFAQEHTTSGKEFWLSFGRWGHYAEPGYPRPDDYPMHRFNPQIRISTIKATRVTIRFSADQSIETIDLQNGEARTIRLNDTQKKLAYSVATGTTCKSIRITSTEPISVYAISQGYGNADATNVLPTVSLGTHYLHMSYKPFGNSEGNFSDGYTIVATEANTTIKKGNSTLATLQQGQVYSYYTNTSGREDLTGTYITSDKPIAYFVTNSGTQIPENKASMDGLYQQMMPLESWGNTFLVPVTIQGKERVRIIASEGSTNLLIQGNYSIIRGSLSNMAAGTFTELEITSGCFISSNKAIGVCSYLLGSTYIGDDNSAYGDPAVAWIPPLQQAVDSISISPIIPGETLLQHHYALIITSTANKAETKIKSGNGTYQPLTGETWVDIAGYSYCSKLLYDANNPTSGTLNYGFTNPDGVIVLGYGLGNTGIMSGESYYYLAGAATRSLNPSFYVNDIHHEDVKGRVFCGPNVTVKAAIYSRALSGFYVKWYLNGTEIYPGENLETWTRTLPAGTNRIRMEVKNYLNEVNSRETEFTINIVDIINPVSDEMTPGDTRQLTGTGFPTTLQGVWESSNPSVATVTQTGLVKAISEGNTVIIYTHNGCSVSLPLAVGAKINLWIGQGLGDPLFTSTQANRNLWSIPANWTANRLPTTDEIVEYHPNAIDLWVDKEYVAKGIKNLTNANLVVLANKKLIITSSYEIGPTSTARVIVKAFIPAYSSEAGLNGTFITPTGLNAVISGYSMQVPIPTEVEFYSKAKTAAGVTNSGLMNWQYFGIPVRSVTANQALAGAAVRRYDETQFNYWVPVTNTETLLPVKGYEISWWETDPNQGLFSFRGDLENRDQSIVLTRTTANSVFNGQHVVSNPYTAGLSIANGLDFGNNLDKTVYLFHTGTSADWDGWIAGGARTNLTGAGQYLAIPQNLAGTMAISSLQGFVVKIQNGLTGTDAARTLKFKYSGVGTNAVLRSSEITENTHTEDDLIYTIAGLSSKGIPKDCMWIFTNQHASRGFDNGYDGHKIFGASRLSQLYAQEKDSNYQINTVNDIDSTWLAFKAEDNISDYTLTFYHTNINQIYQTIYLVDTKDGNRRTDITTSGTEYHFTGMNSDMAEKRFQILSTRNDKPTDNIQIDPGFFNTWQESKSLVLSNRKNKEAQVTIYNIQGATVYNIQVEANREIRINNRLPTGIYFVRANYTDQHVVKKIIIK
ncbi:MAG: Ig-like domain-containing protein [Tannerella sp.]|jgi:hypothetical protein|nr:Ig-like domain-containing protein [Tannerella sp.]